MYVAGCKRTLAYYAFGATVWFSHLSAAGSDPYRDKMCGDHIPAAVAMLITAFVPILGWALIGYFGVRKMTPSSERTGRFAELAGEHQEWAQVWFSISVAVFLAGTI